VDIRVELDSPRVHCGQTLSGQVFVRGDCSKAEKLVIRIGWEATRHGSFHEVTSGILANRFTAQATEQTFSFRLHVPEDAPVSYFGSEVSLSWHCEAYLDVPWAFDPTHKVPFKVEPRPQFERPVRVPAEVTQQGLGQTLAASAGTILLCLFLCLFIPHMIFFAVILGPFVLIWWFMKAMRVSSFTFDISPKEKVMFGQPIHYVLTFRTRTSFDVNEVTIDLVGKEHWTTGSGKSRQSHSREFLHLTNTPAKACRLPSGQFRTEGEFVIEPGNLPTTLSSHYDYRVSANIDIPWWPDVGSSHEITVIGVEAGAEPHEHDERGRPLVDHGSYTVTDTRAASEDDSEAASFDDGEEDSDGDDTDSTCSTCGRQVGAARFCPGCGKRLRP